MKLICINNSSLEIGSIAPITPGNIYETEPNNDINLNYLVMNDASFKSWELKENFITLEEFRDNKLNDLGL
jgi:hypothetical protein